MADVIDDGDFVDRFPEFVEAETAYPGMITSCIASAQRRVDETVWGSTYQDGAMMLAAHLLAISPFGQNARLVAKDGSSTYLTEFERMRDEATFGAGRVL